MLEILINYFSQRFKIFILNKKQEFSTTIFIIQQSKINKALVSLNRMDTDSIKKKLQCTLDQFSQNT